MRLGGRRRHQHVVDRTNECKLIQSARGLPDSHRLLQQRGSSAARDRLSGEAAISGCGASDAAIVFRAQVASLERCRCSAASTRLSCARFRGKALARPGFGGRFKHRRSSSELRRFRKVRALVGPILRPVSSAIGQPPSASSNGPYGGAMALDDGAEIDPATLPENIRLLAEPDGRWAMIVDRAKPRDRDHQRPALAPALRLRDGEPCHLIGLRGVARQRWSAPRRCCARSGGLGR